MDNLEIEEAANYTETRSCCPSLFGIAPSIIKQNWIEINEMSGALQILYSPRLPLSAYYTASEYSYCRCSMDCFFAQCIFLIARFNWILTLIVQLINAYLNDHVGLLICWHDELNGT